MEGSMRIPSELVFHPVFSFIILMGILASCQTSPAIVTERARTVTIEAQPVTLEPSPVMVTPTTTRTHAAVPTNTRAPTQTRTTRPDLTPTPPFLVRRYDEDIDSNAENPRTLIDYDELLSPGKSTGKGEVAWNTPIRVTTGWCTTEKSILNQNIQHISYQLIIDGYTIDLDKLDEYTIEESNSVCFYIDGILVGWSKGKHRSNCNFLKRENDRAS
jgi:hypothetical protein